MGQVYRARDTRLDQLVALKLLSPQLASDPQASERFGREARATYSPGRRCSIVWRAGRLS